MTDVPDNLVMFNGITKLDIDPDLILKSAIGNLSSVVIVGWDKDGEEFFASSAADGGTVLWHLERAKLKLLRKGDTDE